MLGNKKILFFNKNFKPNFIRALFAILLICAASNSIARTSAQRCNSAIYPEAFSICDKALHEFPNDPVVRFNHGLWQPDNRPDLQIEDYSNAIRLDPNYIEAYMHRGIAYYHLAEQENNIEYLYAARTDLTVIIDRAQSKEDVALGYTWRGMSLNLEGKYDQSLADCKEAVKLSQNMLSLLCRGTAYEMTRNYNDALSDYKKYYEQYGHEHDPSSSNNITRVQEILNNNNTGSNRNQLSQQQAQNNSNSQISTDDLSLLKCDVYARKLLGLFTRLSTDKGSDGVAFNQMMVQTFGQDGGLSTYKKILIAVGKFDEEEKRRNLISGAAADNPTWAKYSADVDNKYGQTINALTPLLNETTDCIKKYPQFFN